MEVEEVEEDDLVLEGAKRVVYMEGLWRAWATRWVVRRRGLPPLVVLNALVLPPLAPPPRPAKAWERLSMCSSCSCCCCCCGVCGVWGWVWASLSPASSLAPKKSRGGGRWGKVGGGEAGRTLLLPAITTGMSSKDRRREPWPSAEEADGVEVEGEAGGGVGGEEEEDEGLKGGFLAPKLKLTMVW